MKNKKVLLFLSQGFEEYEAGVFTDVIGWSRELGKEPVEMVSTALRPEIKCKWNLIVRPELEFDKVDINDYDALAIPGGFKNSGYYEDVLDERFQEMIRAFDKDNKIIAAVCAAAAPVAKSGVLKNRKATTYDLTDIYGRAYLADLGVNVQDKHLVIDKNIITSTGPATGLDVAFTLLEMLTSTNNVDEVKKYMRFTNK
ncbi:DJ-1/PfpI family protein [Carboxylicivirga sp. A043]|uniref:DJ-1/PfpI family protein n=1 Tax=Carboxylicivirga litoralis TaxID=2816963 RepID=UPI0021CB8BA9|nr:DJ-1/PfpI family protein [Carboxylicivirga sp. A043]MCU4157030.1 DJ-1/PfpI family protein [Carboxylicivirga sp. A043]